MNGLNVLLWRGERIDDLEAFCREKGFEVVQVETRERLRNFSTNPEPWGPWSEWALEEWPSGIADHCIMQMDQEHRKWEWREVSRRDPKPEAE